jgi:hypothetical protein
MNEERKSEFRVEYIKLVSNPKFGYEDMFKVVQMYIYYRKGEMWQPSGVNLNQLEHAFNYAKDWFGNYFEICILRDKQNKVIKVW